MTEPVPGNHSLATGGGAATPVTPLLPPSLLILHYSCTISGQYSVLGILAAHMGLVTLGITLVIMLLLSDSLE